MLDIMIIITTIIIIYLVNYKLHDKEKSLFFKLHTSIVFGTCLLN